MNEFETTVTKRPNPLGDSASSGRRKPAVDWQRINGEPLPPRRGFLGWLWAAFGWAFKWTAILILVPLFCYLAIGGVGAWLPENVDFKPAPGGVEIFIYSGNAHSEFILPLKTTEKDWTQHFTVTPTGGMSHIAIGWGDRALYTQTQSWSDLKIRTAVSAMLMPTESVLHGEFVHEPYSSSRSVKTRISSAQYQRLCEFVVGSLAEDQPIEGVSFGDFDQFFSAKGDYHLFNTCNNWIGAGMKAAGIKVGRFTPLPKTVFWHLNN
jgi:uncharacterized protein (TIGR02117 family)